jgi:hypothetical protein
MTQMKIEKVKEKRGLETFLTVGSLRHQFLSTKMVTRRQVDKTVMEKFYLSIYLGILTNLEITTFFCDTFQCDGVDLINKILFLILFFLHSVFLFNPT